ncbi:hypothetical protein RJ641_008883 [Dillenia turbinata]|uniref:Uncharacterized protein n=1 Tax=Dillenia turbinata TaxID=194707 RepID=A0AAN8Z5E8_9MAGN
MMMKMTAKPPQQPPSLLSSSATNDLSITAHRRNNNNVNYLSTVFQDLISEGFLSPDSRTLSRYHKLARNRRFQESFSALDCLRLTLSPPFR